MCLEDLRQLAHKSGNFLASDQWCDGIELHRNTWAMSSTNLINRIDIVSKK